MAETVILRKVALGEIMITHKTFAIVALRPGDGLRGLQKAAANTASIAPIPKTRCYQFGSLMQ
jgi:hypothetical protein